MDFIKLERKVGDNWELFGTYEDIYDALEGIPEFPNGLRHGNKFTTWNGKIFRYVPLHEGTAFDLLPEYLLDDLCLAGLNLACSTTFEDWETAYETPKIRRTSQQRVMMSHMDYVAYELLIHADFDVDIFDEVDYPYPSLEFIGLELLLEWLKS